MSEAAKRRPPIWLGPGTTTGSLGAPHAACMTAGRPRGGVHDEVEVMSTGKLDDDEDYDAAAIKQELGQYTPAPASASNEFSPTLYSVEEAKPAAPVQRASSSSASNRRVDRPEEDHYPLQPNLLRQQPPYSAESPSRRLPLSGRSSGDGRFRKASSECSSSAGCSPPPIFG
ncbi:hypothetical protein HETIRDRAFT_104651 [Heterobasidion irregulare TC 32-1]|uniref:Uncharacterized protein n=1 Tax=Heterobasidion irregulare (strain TC 32-1) TaxID=747525 RepID=W4K665_HETIT|nr:uncharacterized protein HETIRDRAFT_104651 [Heterobasidion irregulare TC 32-1]ETW81264.1 hypothetical protein HETIRDRAFT_104651 [Heterobasidion irregulare TC 32-1]